MMSIRRKHAGKPIAMGDHHRLCPSCHEMIGTQAGKFNPHGSTAPGKESYCRMSCEKVGGPVPPAPKPMPRKPRTA